MGNEYTTVLLPTVVVVIEETPPKGINLSHHSGWHDRARHGAVILVVHPIYKETALSSKKNNSVVISASTRCNRRGFGWKEKASRVRRYIRPEEVPLSR